MTAPKPPAPKRANHNHTGDQCGLVHSLRKCADAPERIAGIMLQIERGEASKREVQRTLRGLRRRLSEAQRYGSGVEPRTSFR